MMKRNLALILCAALLMIIAIPTSGSASTSFTDWILHPLDALRELKEKLDNGNATLVQEETVPEQTQKKEPPPVWDFSRINRDFPEVVLRDVSRECQRDHGTVCNTLGLVATRGSRLRSRTDFSDASSIMQIHGSVTIFVYYSFYVGNRLWYYAVTPSGVEGYLAASRIQLVR